MLPDNQIFIKSPKEFQKLNRSKCRPVFVDAFQDR